MKACFFDIDGTLVLTGRAGQFAFADTFAEDFGVPELSKDVSFAGRSDRGIAGGLFEAHGIENNDQNWRRFLEGYLPRLKEELPRRQGEVLPGVLKLIEQVEALGDVLIGLLTGNTAAAAQLKLSHYGLWDRFSFGGFGDVHPDRNDIAANAADQARQRHDGPAAEERIVVIGDTPNDVRCARSIGALAVAVPTGPTPALALAAANPDLLIPTLEESDVILEWLAA